VNPDLTRFFTFQKAMARTRMKTKIFEKLDAINEIEGALHRICAVVDLLRLSDGVGNLQSLQRETLPQVAEMVMGEARLIASLLRQPKNQQKNS
jgi:hypothetical protein